MRSYSFFTILLLCLAIFIVDLVAFRWLQSISGLIPSLMIRKVINLIFWIFSVGLIGFILLLKIRLEKISRQRKPLLISFLYGLTVSSFIPKLIFVLIIATLYYTNAAFSTTESLVLIPIIGLIAGLLSFFFILYAIFISLYRFKIHTIKIDFENLPASFNGLRIIHISDAHLGSFNYRYHIFDRAVHLINEQEPDFIFFTGDIVNNFASELSGWDNTLKPLTAKKGKYAVLGNHDYGDYFKWFSLEERNANFEEIKNFYKKIDFKLLLNEAAIIENNNEKILIAGVENWGNPPFKQYGDLKKSLIGTEAIHFKILLSHDPSHWPKEIIKETNIALTLSGHTHGMQAGINLKNKKWSPIKYKYKHWAGLYDEDGQYLYVNRGLGWLGFPGRLGMRPEITLIELQRKVTDQ